jgi:hypothetical protein
MMLDLSVKKAEVGLVVQSRGCGTILTIRLIMRVQVSERTKAKPLFWLNTRRDVVGEAGVGFVENQAPRRDIAPKHQGWHCCRPQTAQSVNLQY